MLSTGIHQNYLKCNGSTNKKEAGLPMRSPLSPLFAEILTNHIIQNSETPGKIYVILV